MSFVCCMANWRSHSAQDSLKPLVTALRDRWKCLNGVNRLCLRRSVVQGHRFSLAARELISCISSESQCGSEMGFYPIAGSPTTSISRVLNQYSTLERTISGQSERSYLSAPQLRLDPKSKASLCFLTVAPINDHSKLTVS